MTLLVPQTTATSARRVISLDGLRGVAACAVATFHFFYAFAPRPFMNEARAGFSLFDTPVAALWNGPFAVAVFFALSGFVLTASGPRSAQEAPLLIGLRYVRLAAPALLSSILGWAWLSAFPNAAREAQALGGSDWFRWTHQPPIPPLSQAIFEGAIDAFLIGNDGFNNSLWTMRVEFLGSLMIYGVCAATKGRPRVALLVAGLVGFALAQSFSFAAFCGGALIFEFRGRLRDMPVGGAILGLIGLVLGATYPGHADGPSLLDAIQSRLGAEGFRQAGALLVILSMLTTPWLRRAFERPGVQRVGELSFPLYLVHVPLIVAPASWAFVAFHPLSPLGLTGLFAATALGAFLLGSIFLVLVERPLLTALRAMRARGHAQFAAS